MLAAAAAGGGGALGAGAASEVEGPAEALLTAAPADMLPATPPSAPCAAAAAAAAVLVDVSWNQVVSNPAPNTTTWH